MNNYRKQWLYEWMDESIYEDVVDIKWHRLQCSKYTWCFKYFEKKVVFK